MLVLTASIVTALYRVHQATQFTANDPRSELGYFPAINAVNNLEMGEVEEAEEIPVGGPMNILLFYADDWCHDTLGVAGNPVVKTPVLDALAADGVRFSENCVTTSICWISCATLYSGQYLA